MTEQLYTNIPPLRPCMCGHGDHYQINGRCLTPDCGCAGRTIDMTGASDAEFRARVAAFDAAPTPPECDPERVETVARAMCEADPDYTEGGERIGWERWFELTRDFYRRLAAAAIAADPSPAEEAVTGVALIAAERHRQIEAEGWTPEHDAEHDTGWLALAAAVYAVPPEDRDREVRALWPWRGFYFKPTPNDRVRELVKAGALIAAEIDRLRAALASPAPAPRPAGKVCRVVVDGDEDESFLVCLTCNPGAEVCCGHHLAPHDADGCHEMVARVKCQCARRPAPAPQGEPDIGDTCCGRCPGSSCYVDQVTGA